MTNTPFQYAEGNGTITVATAGNVIASFLGKAGSLSQNSLIIDKSVYSFGYGINGTPVEWWICIEILSSNATFRASANLEYFA